MIRWFALLGVLVFSVGGVVAQAPIRASFDTETPSPATGEPLVLTLLVYTPPGYEVLFPTFPERWGDFTVLEVREPLVASRGVETVQAMEIRVVPWGLGEISTPLTQVTVSNGSVQEVVTVEPLFLSIPNILGDLPELRRRRAVVELFYLPPWVIVGLGAMVVGGGGWLGWWWVRWRRARRPQQVKAKAQRTLAERSIQALRRLEYDAPDWTAQYAGMGDTLRVYITERYEIPAEMTTTELLSDTVEQLHEAKTIRYLLEQAELAKFAPGTVAQPAEKPIIELAVSWIRESERSRGRP